MKKILIPLLMLAILTSILLSVEENTEKAEKTEINLEIKDSLYTMSDSVDIAEDSNKTINDSIFYSADNIFFNVLKSRISLRGNSKITYRQSIILADTLEIDNEKKFLFSKGSIKMQDNDNLILGDQLNFDFSEKEGIVRQGATKFDLGFCYGSSIRKIADDIYDIDDGIFTTCDAKYPHFYIKAAKMRYYSKDKVLGKPLVFYVNHFPIFAFPYGSFSMKRGRKYGFLMPNPGYNSSDGKYIKDISFYFPYKNLADFLLRFDYKEKKGWESKFSADYKKRYYYNGALRTRFQRNIFDNEHLSDEWYVRLRHNQNISQEEQLRANINFVSSKEIFSGDDSIEDRTKSDVNSEIFYTKEILGRNLSVYLYYNENLDTNEKNLLLPKISYSFPSKPLGEFFDNEDSFINDLNYSYSFKAVHSADINSSESNFSDILYKNKKDSTGYINLHKVGIYHSLSTTYSRKLFWLSLSQQISYREAWYERDKLDNRFVRANSYSSTSKANFSLYGIKFFPDSKYISAVRHIVKPSVSFSYRPDFSKNDKYYYFDGIGVSSGDRVRKFSFSLRNGWSVKLPANAFREKEKKINDYISTTSSLSFDLEKEGDRFGTISHSYDLNPYEKSDNGFSFSFSNSGSVKQSPYNFEFQTINFSNSISFSGDASYKNYFPIEKNKFDKSRFVFQDSTKDVKDSLATDSPKEEDIKKDWSLRSTHNYTKDLISKEVTANYFRNEITFKLSKNWDVSYNNYYDFHDKKLLSQDIGINRNLHCWKIRFSWSKTDTYWSYNLRFFNIKLPDTFKYHDSGSGGNY